MAAASTSGGRRAFDVIVMRMLRHHFDAGDGQLMAVLSSHLTLSQRYFALLNRYLMGFIAPLGAN